jgi:hypothetical protein
MIDEHGKRWCDRCGCELTEENNKHGYEICDSCDDILEGNMVFIVTYISGNTEKYIIKLNESENYRDAWVKVARIASVHGEIKKIIKSE